MIGAELRARIRRLFYAEHWKVGTIAAELGVHADTVTRAIESDRFAPRARPVRPTLLDPYKAYLAEVLAQYPRLRAPRLYEMLRQRGYPGSLIQLRRYLRTVRAPDKGEAFLRLETMPGEQGQVDWGHFGTLQVGAAKRTLSCFVLVLSHSRAMFARFFLNQTMESFLCGHIAAFEALGGVPRTLLYDNLKSVVVERDGDLIRFNPQLLEMAGHYHFAPKPCAPYRGNEKGKVERTIQYLRHAFFAARQFNSVAELNAQLRRWIDEVAHARPVPGWPYGSRTAAMTGEEASQSRDDVQPGEDAREAPELTSAVPGATVAAALERERARLLPLPTHPFPAEHVAPVRSGKTPYVRFDSNDYSIPHTLVRQSLTLVASETRVRLLDTAQRVVAEHQRSYDAKQLVEDPAHLRALAQTKRRAHESAGRQRLMHACPHAAPFFAELCARDEPMRAHIVRLGRLLDAYGPNALDDAIAQAVKRGAVSAASVAHILDQQRRQHDEPPRLLSVLSRDPRVHAIHATPHALAPYDALAADDTASTQRTDDSRDAGDADADADDTRGDPMDEYKSGSEP